KKPGTSPARGGQFSLPGGYVRQPNASSPSIREVHVMRQRQHHSHEAKPSSATRVRRRIKTAQTFTCLQSPRPGRFVNQAYIPNSPEPPPPEAQPGVFRCLKTKTRRLTTPSHLGQDESCPAVPKKLLLRPSV
ncbi:hypothetical protein JMJ77_0014359, partial [Colletotrichum scovillei]